MKPKNQNKKQKPKADTCKSRKQVTKSANTNNPASSCTLNEAGIMQCCCNCVHLRAVHYHCCTSPTPKDLMGCVCSVRKGWACVLPDHDRVYDNWPQHSSGCELYTPKNPARNDTQPTSPPLKVGDRVTVYDRYRLAVPHTATILHISDNLHRGVKVALEDTPQSHSVDKNFWVDIKQVELCTSGTDTNTTYDRSTNTAAAN